MGRTGRLRVGTAACILSNRHPVALSEEAVLLDELSAGRLDPGAACGGPWIALKVFGTGLDRYANGFAESLDLLPRRLSAAEKAGAADSARLGTEVLPRSRQLTLVSHGDSRI